MNRLFAKDSSFGDEPADPPPPGRGAVPELEDGGVGFAIAPRIAQAGGERARRHPSAAALPRAMVRGKRRRPERAFKGCSSACVLLRVHVVMTRSSRFAGVVRGAVARRGAALM